MAYSSLSVTANGSTNIFSIPFPHNEQSDVHCYVAGVEVFGFTWPTGSTIQLGQTAASLSGLVVLVQRITPVATPDVVFSTGALPPANLNLSAQQALYAIQEIVDAIPGLPTSIIQPPTATLLGGVFSSTAPSNQWCYGVNISGQLLYSQPGFTSFTGYATPAQGGLGTASPLTGYLYGNGAGAATASTTIPFTSMSGSVAAGQMPALTGDITTTAGAVASTLATVNSNVGTYGSSSVIPVVTVNAKGLVTAVTTAAAPVASAWTAILEDHETSGTNGTSVTPPSATTVCVLNSTVYDPSSLISSLASNQFTLAAGTYLIEWSVPWAANTTATVAQSQLFNVTAGALVGYGESVSAANYLITLKSSGAAIVTIAGPTVYELKLTNSGAGKIGLAASMGTEVYSRVVIRRLV